MNKHLLAGFCLLSASLFFACSQSTGLQSGTMVGHVILVNNNGSQPADRSHVAVLVEGRTDTVFTDANGSFTLSASEGIYSLSFSKAGYGTMKSINNWFPGGGQMVVNTVTLSQPPTFSVSGFSVTKPTNSTSLNVADTLTDTNSVARRLILFLGRTSTVSSNPANYFATNTLTPTVSKGISTSTITQTTLRNSGFVAGDTIWFVAYAANEYGQNSTYTDAVSGRITYANLNATPSKTVFVVSP